MEKVFHFLGTVKGAKNRLREINKKVVMVTIIQIGNKKLALFSQEFVHFSESPNTSPSDPFMDRNCIEQQDCSRYLSKKVI